MLGFNFLGGSGYRLTLDFKTKNKLLDQLIQTEEVLATYGAIKARTLAHFHFLLRSLVDSKHKVEKAIFREFLRYLKQSHNITTLSPCVSARDIFGKPDDPDSGWPEQWVTSMSHLRRMFVQEKEDEVCCAINPYLSHLFNPLFCSGCGSRKRGLSRRKPKKSANGEIRGEGGRRRKKATLRKRSKKAIQQG